MEMEYLKRITRTRRRENVRIEDITDCMKLEKDLFGKLSYNFEMVKPFD